MTVPAGVFPFATPNNSAIGTLASATSNGGTGDRVTLATDGLGSIDFALDGTPVGASVVFEATSDGGTTWLPRTAYQSGVTPQASGSSTANAAGVYNVSCGGKQQVRVRLTAITSGSFSVTANGTGAAAHVGVKNGNAADLQVTATLALAGSSVSSGNPLPVSVVSGGGGGGGGNAAAGATGAAVPADADYLGFNIGGNLTGVSAANPLPVLPPAATLTDRSGSVTTGGTAQQLAAANAARKGWRIQNTSGGDQWFNDTGGSASVGGAGCFKVSSGGYYETPAGGASQTAISIFGATTGQTFSASEW